MPHDSHIHLYPPTVYENPHTWAAANSESAWLSLVSPSSGPQLQAFSTVRQLLTDMDDAGIEKAVILGWYWENHDTCVQNIDWQIDWIQQHHDRLIAFAPFNAKGGPAALDHLKRAFDAGLCGIGELNPPVQGYAYHDETLNRALDLAAQVDAPVNFHVTDPNTHDYPGKVDTPFLSLCSMAERHPNTKFIFAHLAGMMKLDQLVFKNNIYLDTAATPLLYPKSIYRKVIDTFGIDRLLFGTDYPLRTFPKSQSRPDFTHHLARIQNSNLSEEELHKITSTNLEILLGGTGSVRS
ncbi:MAG: amidohydrolase family protein [Verrucomicrobiota bacterium]